MSAEGDTTLDDLRLVLRLESHRMGAISESTLRSVIKRLESAEKPLLVWRPMTERPSPPAATAMIRCTDDRDGAHLLPGPVMWSRREECWVDEREGQAVPMTESGAVYEWCYERDITRGRP